MGLAKWEIKRVPRINPLWISWCEVAGGGMMFMAIGRGIPSVCYYSTDKDGMSYVPRLHDLPFDFNRAATLKMMEEITADKPYMLAATEELETFVQMMAQCETCDDFRNHPNFVLISNRNWNVSLFRVPNAKDDCKDLVEHFHTDASMIARAPADLDAYIYTMPVPWMCVTYRRNGELVYVDHFVVDDPEFMKEHDSDMVRVWGEWIQRVYDMSAIAADYLKAQVNEL